MPHVGWWLAQGLSRKSKTGRLGNNPGEKTLPSALQQWLIKTIYYIFSFLHSLNPLFIVRVVWDWLGGNSLWWQWSEKRALPTRASEVNGPVSMLTGKAWLEPSGASKALSSSVFWKIIFEEKTGNDNVKKKGGVLKWRFNRDFHQMELPEAKADLSWDSGIGKFFVDNSCGIDCCNSKWYQWYIQTFLQHQGLQCCFEGIWVMFEMAVFGNCCPWQTDTAQHCQIATEGLLETVCLIVEDQNQ